MSVHRTLPQALAGEILGTYLLVLFGTGSVAAAVLTSAQIGLWQVAVVWGFGVTIAIYASATLSGAHLNPAVSLAFALLRRQDFPLARLLPYVSAQLLGAMLASATVAALFWPFLLRFEATKGIVRGAPGSELSGMVFGEYFPNPAMFGTDEAARSLVSPWQAACVEGFGTAVLVLVIFALTTPKNRDAPSANLIPFFIGFTVAVLISLFAPITQAGWNPARDFGPRVVAYVLGWGAIAIPGPAAGFWAYVVGPLIGGPLGGLVWQVLAGDRGPAARTVPSEKRQEMPIRHYAPVSPDESSYEEPFT
jgi:glycerol uptake facilitator protein